MRFFLILTLSRTSLEVQDQLRRVPFFFSGRTGALTAMALKEPFVSQDLPNLHDLSIKVQDQLGSVLRKDDK